MQMPGRTYQATSTSKYRYSINGQEKESELNENITTAKFWEYDSRILRRWNQDPEGTEYESPYLCFNGSPIQMADPDGNKPTDIIYRNTAGKEIARQKTTDNFDQIITVLKGTVTVDGQSVSMSADYKQSNNFTTVYHNRHPQQNTSTPPTTKKSPSQAPVNTKQQPQSTTTQKSTVDKANDVVSATGIGISALSPTFEDGAARVVRSGGNPSLSLKKNIFVSPHTPNNRAIVLGKMNGKAVKVINSVLKPAAPVLTVVSAGITAYNILKDGKVTTGEAFTAVNTTLQIVFPVYGFIYAAVDLGFGFFTNKSLSDRIQDGIDNTVGGEIQFGGTKK
jgi:hypothetical protein